MSRLLYLAELLRLGWPRRSGRLRSGPILPQRDGRDPRSARAVVVEATELATLDETDHHVVVRGPAGRGEPVRSTGPAQVPGVLDTERPGGVDEHVLPLLSYCFSIDNVEGRRSHPGGEVRRVTQRAGRGRRGAPLRNRTVDLLLTMETLCRLS